MKAIAPYANDLPQWTQGLFCSYFWEDMSPSYTHILVVRQRAAPGPDAVIRQTNADSSATGKIKEDYVH